MIHFDITSSPDLLSIGSQKYNLHHINIGRNMKNTIIIDDIAIEKEHALVRLNKKSLIIESRHSYLVNGKKVSGTVILKKDDQLQIGNTVIKILDYSTDSIPEPKDYYTYLEKLAHTEKELFDLVNSLEEEYVRIANRNNNVLEE